MSKCPHPNIAHYSEGQPPFDYCTACGVKVFQGTELGGKKFDQGKAPLAQACLAYFGLALEEIAQVSAYGAKKYTVAYADQNWRSVEGAAGRYADALARHLAAHLRGETHDPESGLRHLAHGAWNALALLELTR